MNVYTIRLNILNSHKKTIIAVYLKQLKPSIKIVAVESEESACFIKAKEAGQPTELDSVGIFADGVAVKVMGQETFRLCNRLVDETLTVTNDEICGAIKDIFDDTRVIAEPAGALSVAAIRKYVKQHNLKGKKLGGILCGATGGGREGRRGQSKGGQAREGLRPLVRGARTS